MSDDAMRARDEMAGDGAGAGAPPKPVYDQEFFLKLARPREDTDEARAEARERWNKWRRDPANEGVAVTFDGVDFSAKENLLISFSSFEFGDGASFSNAKFHSRVLFEHAIFGNHTWFDRADFWGDNSFNGAVFGDWTIFAAAKFGRDVSFLSVKFGDDTQFSGSFFELNPWFHQSKFGDRVSFIGVTFGEWTSFTNSVFGFGASFVGATFGYGAEFDHTIFGAGAEFSKDFSADDHAARRNRWADANAFSSMQDDDASRDQSETSGCGSESFSSISFAAARFAGSVSFARRSFGHPADFTDVCFDAPPDFDGATNLQRIDFTGARAGFAPADRPWWKPDWTTDSRIAIRLRTLRSLIEATKNHDFERDLYIEERKAERGIHLARLWNNLRPRRLIETALAYVGGLPRLPKIDIFAERGEPVVRWPQPPRNRRGDARPAMIGDGPAAVRLRRAYRRNGARFLAALGPLLGHLLWIAVMAVYWALSDYGRSWLRPALCLGVVLVLFHGLGPVDGITARALGAKRVEIVAAAEAARPGSGGDIGSAWDEAAKLYAVANSIPFVGPLTIDGEVKKFLFCGAPPPAPSAGATAPASCIPLPPAALQAATIVQNLLSILLVFFIGLALRNYFRLK